MNRLTASSIFASTAAVLGLALPTFAAPVVDGTMSLGEWGAPVATYSDNWVNGSDATGGTNQVSTYFAFDANFVYGSVHFDGGAAGPFPGSNVYFYSSSANFETANPLVPGVYGDHNDYIAEGANGWGYATPSGIEGGIHYAYDPSTVNYAFNGTDTVEFSIARSILGDYSTYRFGGQLFGYEFHTGGGDREPGALVSVPEPTSIALLTLAGAGLMARRRSRIA